MFIAVSCLSPVSTHILMSALAKLAIVSGTPCNTHGKIVMLVNVIIFLSISLNMCFRCSKEPVLLSTHNICFG